MTNKDSSAIFDGFKGNLGELIPILHRVQEKIGYISEEAVEQVSRFLKITPNEIYGVASFYKQFRFVESGKYTIKVCMGTACHVRGAVSILEEFERKLGIGPDETTADKLFTLETVNCLGACALGPIVVFGEDYHGQMKMKAVEELIEKARSEKKEEAGALT